jgi:hypothetical protein
VCTRVTSTRKNWKRKIKESKSNEGTTLRNRKDFSSSQGKSNTLTQQQAADAKLIQKYVGFSHQQQH